MNYRTLTHRGAISTSSIIAGATMLLGVVGWVFGQIGDIQKTQAAQGERVSAVEVNIGNIKEKVNNLDVKFDANAKALNEKIDTLIRYQTKK